MLGYYSSLLALHISPLGLTHWIAVDSMLIAFATRFALAPCALSGLVAGLRPGAPPAERAFSALTITFGALVLIETAAYATNGSPRFQERYLVVLMGLVPIAFLVGIRALPRGKWLAIALSIVLFVCLARIPLTGYSAVSGKQDSPFLRAIFYSQRYVGSGASGLLVAIVGGALLAVGAAAALRPRLGASIALALAGGALAFASLGATSDDLAGARNARASYLGDDLRWVDDAKLGSLDMLLSPASFPPALLEHLFWNTSLTGVLALPGSNLVDTFGQQNARIARDGRVVVHGFPVRRPVLVDGYYTAITLQDARLIQRTLTAALWDPSGPVRLSTMTVGRYFDGWLDRKAVVTVWPGGSGPRSGTLHFRLTLPSQAKATPVVLRTPGKQARTVLVRPDRPTEVAFQLFVTHPVQVEIVARQDVLLGGRVVSVQSTAPRFIESSTHP